MYDFDECITVDLAKSSFAEFDFERCKCLTIYHHRSKDGNFCGLPDIPDLEALRVYFTNAASFKGLERYSALRSLEMRYCPKIMDVCGLPADYISELEIENAPKLKGYKDLARLKHLKTLSVNECGDIESLEFLLMLTELEEFRFVGTKILDKDLSVLLSHPSLKRVAGYDRRTYSHHIDDINRVLESQRGSAN